MTETPHRVATDRSLLRRLRDGRPDAATDLYLRYAERLRALAGRQTPGDLKARVDPDDIVQSVFRTFFHRCKRDGYDVPEGEDLWKLFLVIALRKVRNAASHHHAAKRDTRLTAHGVLLEQVAGTDEVELSLLRMTVDEQMGSLDPAQRRVIDLRIEGFEVAEIAERSGRSKRSVERVLQSFRQQLEGRLDAEPR